MTGRQADRQAGRRKKPLIGAQAPLCPKSRPTRMLTVRANKSGFKDILEMLFGMGRIKFPVPPQGKFYQKDKFLFKASLSQYWPLNYSNRSILEVILIDNRRHGNDCYL